MRDFTATTTTTTPIDELDGKPRLVVRTFFHAAGVDRPETVAFSLGAPSSKSSALALRLSRAIEAGAVFTDHVVKTDVNGAAFVSSDHHVMGRRMNADLNRLGF